MKRVLFSAVAIAALMGASVTRAQDPVKVDPNGAFGGSDIEGKAAMGSGE